MNGLQNSRHAYIYTKYLFSAFSQVSRYCRMDTANPRSCFARFLPYPPSDRPLPTTPLLGLQAAPKPAPKPVK